MSQLIHISFCLVVICWLSACADLESKEPKIYAQDSSVGQFRESEYLKHENGVFEIKKEAAGPLWFNKEGLLVGSQQISAIPHKESSYLLIPQKHSSVQHLIDNPFACEKSVRMARPSIWGRALILQKIDKNTALFRIDENLTDPELPSLSPEKLAELFPKYDEQSLGKGGAGEVFKIVYKGQEYALKENAHEVFVMERLQFTDAVAKIYAMFRIGNKPFMIMELGKKSLLAHKEKLSEQQVLDASMRFKILIDAHEALSINNHDIKPHNLLLTQSDRLVVIDISGNRTPGYHGTQGQLFARALLENQLNMSLTSGYLPLDRFYDFSPKKRVNIASPYIIKAWNRIVCKKLFPSDQKKCDGVDSYDTLFPLLPKPTILEIAKRKNQKEGDQFGTHDIGRKLLYKTNLPMPNMQDISEQDWGTYFAKKEKIGKNFCSYIMSKEAFSASDRTFFEPLKTSKYTNYCEEQSGDWTFKLNFSDYTDPNFRSWIEDAFAPHVKAETFQQLATETKIDKDFYKELIKLEYDISKDQIGQVIFELFQYKEDDD